MRFVIENKTLMRCELAADERDVEVEVPDFVERADAGEGSFATVDYVERIGAGAFEGASGRIARLVLPGHLRAVDEGAFAGLGMVKELVVHSYDDACSNEMCNDLDNPIACQRLTVLPNHGSSNERDSYFDLCLIDDTYITELELDANVRVRYSPGRQLAECGGFGLENVETLTYLLREASNEIDPYLIMVTGMHHNLRRLVFENCCRIEDPTTWVSRPSRCGFVAGSSMDWMSSLEEVVLPEGLVRIGDRLFEDDRKLRTVRVPMSLREIGSHAFRNCSALEGLTIPELALPGVSPSAFTGCTKLPELETVRWSERLGMPEHVARVPLRKWAAVTNIDRLVSLAEGQYPELRREFRPIELPYTVFSDGSVVYDDPIMHGDPDQYWDYMFHAYLHGTYNAWRTEDTPQETDAERLRHLREIREVVIALLQSAAQ